MEKSEESLKDLPFMDPNLDIEKRIDNLLSRLTLDEKISLCSGKRFFWTKPVKRLGIPSFKMTDGPHGVGSGILFLKKMMYFPVAICRTATWNLELSKQFGEALGEEVRSVGYHMILAPGINIQRTPLCGRTFEYQTEDPYLNAKTAVAVVKGVQSKRVGTCIKHFAANNQEYNRFKVSTEVSRRALEEIYYPAFKAAVEEGDAWSVMACYNRLNGTFGCEHYELIRETLINKWGFRGFVVSDWFATRFTRTTECIKAGLTLEMPVAKVYKDKKIKEGLQNGDFTEKELDDNLRRLLRVMFLAGLFDDPESLPIGCRNTPEHKEIARKIAEEGIVLLKNDDNILPLDPSSVKKIAVLGPNANKKMAFGGGSSMVRAKYEITPYKGLKAKCKELKIKLTKSPAKADVVIIFAGLNHGKFMDRENKDRLYLELPKKQIKLIKETAKINPNIIVVLINGSPVAMDDWINEVPAIIEAWYAGAESGNAIASILFGDVNPSGKLPITFPKKLSDSPAHKDFRTYPGLKDWSSAKEGDIIALRKNKGMVIFTDDDDKVYYDEGIYVGYRHFDKNNIEPLFPFGHGLSYTTFDYKNLKLSSNSIKQDEKLTISLDITNSGNRAGAEVVQLYIQDVECSIDRPVKELKGFEKIFLEPGQTQKVEFEVGTDELSFFDEDTESWKVEPGKFKVLIGSSSRDIRLEGEFEYIS